MFSGWIVLLAFGLTTLTLVGAGQMSRVREVTLDRAFLVNLIWWDLALLVGLLARLLPEEDLWIVVLLLYFLRLCLIRWGFGLRWRKALDVFIREWVLQQLVLLLLTWIIGPHSAALRPWWIPLEGHHVGLPLLFLTLALTGGGLLRVYAGILLRRGQRGD